ncbi:hypothetical protein Pcinc_031829 [Petrolisthes cinctipes]|uniref:Uncharacterized protein n=1 Tax=Petrolisthes cinctipes TaxID=88211 RepID=A0AAE1EVT7_PETCI|nr:hypothetical protein Pcinc_031829 [Petrolisthes cinctipes]
MRAMTNPKTGATQKILQLFYLQAIRTHVDYSAPALVALSDSKWKSLEPIQNKAMKTMTGSPPGTSSPPLLIETGLVPLGARIQERVACLAAKIMQQGRNCQAEKMIKRNMPRNPPPNDSWKKKWEREISKAIKRNIDQETITARGHGQPDLNWNDRKWKIIIQPPRLAKKNTTSLELQQLGRETRKPCDRRHMNLLHRRICEPERWASRNSFRHPRSSPWVENI